MAGVRVIRRGTYRGNGQVTATADSSVLFGPPLGEKRMAEQ